MEDFIELRKQKLQALKDKNIDPYGGKFVRTGNIKQYVDNFSENTEVSVAGRLMTYRGHGKAVFCDIHDFTGKIQIYVRKDKIGDEQFEVFKCVDIGDILGVKGAIFKTHTGEITILVTEFTVLSKALRTLPEKWHGLQDIETRYRQRYLDLISNKEVRDIFVKRAKIISTMRRLLDGDGFVEVETPMMQSLPGGANAKPFITHHSALDIDLYLRIAPELFLKRLLVGGFERVYEINRNFRNEGISRVHNPEFTMLEVYAAFENCEYMMNLTEHLITTIAKEVTGEMKVRHEGDVEVDFSTPWKRETFYGIIKSHAGVDLSNEPKENYPAIAKKLNVHLEKDFSAMDILDEIFKNHVEKKLIQPTFVTDYPLEMCPLAKAKKGVTGIADRFELFINGMEIANAYSELNDPAEQHKRFVEQLSNDHTGAKTVDEDYVHALEHGMPPAGGLGIGIDRLVMMLTGKDSIREVILFPQLRPQSV